MAYRREFQQGSEAWLDWRRGGVGASDAPAIMGVSPWMDVEALWLEKTGRATGRPSSFAMRRGQLLEPEARARPEAVGEPATSLGRAGAARGAAQAAGRSDPPARSAPR